MRDSPSSSRPSSTPSGAELARHGLFLLATALSVFVTGVTQSEAGGKLGLLGAFTARAALRDGAAFTAGLLGFLLVHELGHYVAARLHRVPASLPFFLPLPLLSPFGTLGAVIRMRGAIADRRALLDIGAAGPLAGLAVAIPLYAYGVAHSRVVADDGSFGMTLGDSLLLRALDHLFAPATAPGETILLSPVAFAAWGGFFVTMVNLLPLSQLDGGHVAYALGGEGHNRRAPTLHRVLLVFFLVSLAASLVQDARAGLLLAKVGERVSRSLFWFVWFEVLGVLGAFAAERSAAAEAEEHEENQDVTTDVRVEAAAVPPLSARARAACTIALVGYASLARESTSAAAWLPWFGALVTLLALEARAGLLRPHTLLAHPETDPASPPLGLGRKVVGAVTLAFFVLLFLPTPMTL